MARPDGETGGAAVLDDQQARFVIDIVIDIEHIWLAQEFLRDDVMRSEEAVIRITEARGGVNMGVQFEYKLLLWDLCAWI